MILKLNLESVSDNTLLPINYQYPLSAAIYKILQYGDTDYATFLHEQGYGKVGSLKRFKLFCFSDIRTPFKIMGDRLRLLTRRASLRISFHLPIAAENFIKGIFQSQVIEIADQYSKGIFTVANVEAIPSPLTSDNIQERLLTPLSPIVCGIKNVRGHYDFLPPNDINFLPMLLSNWKAKYQSTYCHNDITYAFEDVKMKFIPYKTPVQSRLMTIKAGGPQETKIKGYTNFQIQIRAKREAFELLINSGMGLYNALGCGSMTA